MTDKKFWILTAEQHEQHVDALCARIKKDLIAQYRKGSSKHGEVNLFTDTREFGYIPVGSEPYMEMIDTINYAVVFGTEKKRRHDAVARAIR